MSVTISSPAVRSFYGSRSARVVSLSRARVIMAVQSNVTVVASILTKLKNDCATPLPVLRHVAVAMAEDMRAGLLVDGGSDLKMILSYVDTLPTGNEKGLFYALDLGGTNFRVLRVQLGGKEGRVVATEFEQFAIPPELMFGTSEVDLILQYKNILGHVPCSLTCLLLKVLIFLRSFSTSLLLHWQNL